MNEIEEDDDCDDHHDIEDADESVDIYTKSAFLENESSDHFLGAINWQQEAIEQEINDQNINNNSHESQDSNDIHQDDHSNFSLNQNHEENENHFRSIEDDSNNSL